MLDTFMAYLHERLSLVAPGSLVRVEQLDSGDLSIWYKVPARALLLSREGPVRAAAQAVTRCDPTVAMEQMARNSARRQQMAIGRFRLGRFGRPS